MLTPLTESLDIDHARLAAHAKGLIASGCGGVTIFGTTGEGPSFSMAERREALDQMIAHGVPAERIMVSTSCAALPETLALTRHAVSVGVHGCLMLPPFFLKGVSDEGILHCYRQVIDAVADPRLKLYLYHIPQVTGVGLSHHVIATLKREYPKIILGIKDSACTTTPGSKRCCHWACNWVATAACKTWPDAVMVWPSQTKRSQCTWGAAIWARACQLRQGSCMDAGLRSLPCSASCHWRCACSKR